MQTMQIKFFELNACKDTTPFHNIFFCNFREVGGGGGLDPWCTTPFFIHLLFYYISLCSRPPNERSLNCIDTKRTTQHCVAMGVRLFSCSVVRLLGCSVGGGVSNR